MEPILTLNDLLKWADKAKGWDEVEVPSKIAIQLQKAQRVGPRYYPTIFESPRQMPEG